MTNPTIEINQAQLESVRRLLAAIGSTERLAIRRAVQRTTTGTKTQVSKELGKKVTLKATFIKQQISSQVIELGGRISITGNPIVLAAYSTSPTLARSQQSNTNGVAVKVFKDKAAVRLQHAFFSQMPTGHIGLFMRAKGANGRLVHRLKINELLGPSAPSVYDKTPGLSQLVETTAADRLQRELDHQVQYILSNHTRVN
jgi:hypothetical protein